MPRQTSTVFHQPDIFDDIKREERSGFPSGFGDNEVVECVMVGNDQILFDEHQVVDGASLQLVELLLKRVQSFLEELRSKGKSI